MQTCWVGVRWDELHPAFRGELASAPYMKLGDVEAVILGLKSGDLLGVGTVVACSRGTLEVNTTAYQTVFERVREIFRRFSLPVMGGGVVRMYIESVDFIDHPQSPLNRILRP